MKHHCRERERLDELRTPVGQAAYSYYSEWLKLKKRSVPEIETFASSSFYSTFIKFANYVQRVKLPNPLGFIRLMVENGDVQPSIWCRDNVYALYLQKYDETVSPIKQFVDSYDTLMQLARDFDAKPTAVLKLLGVSKVLELVQKRKLSPWFLIASQSFRDFKNSCSELDKQRLEEGVQISAMVMRIKESEKLMDLFTEFTRAAKEMEI